MGSLTVAQRFEVMSPHGFARAKRYMELSDRSAEMSNDHKSYLSACRAIYALEFMGKGMPLEQVHLAEYWASRRGLELHQVDREIYTWGMGGYGSPSLQEDFLLDVWCRQEIAARNGWELDVLSPEWQAWCDRFSMRISEILSGTATRPDLPKPIIKKSNGFDTETPFPDYPF